MFFSSYGAHNIFGNFIIFEMANVIFLREAVYRFLLVLLYSSFQVVGYTCVEDRMFRVGHNVDEILSVVHRFQIASSL